MDIPSESSENNKNTDGINDISNNESVVKDKMAAEENVCKNVVDSTGENKYIKDLVECIQSVNLENLPSSKETMDIVEEIQKTQHENHETKHDLLNPVDLQNELVCLDDEDPIKLIEDEQNVRQNETEDPLGLVQNALSKGTDFSTTEAEIVEKIAKIHISQEKNEETVTKKQVCSSTAETQIFDIILAEDNKELYIIPDTKTPNGVQAKKDGSVSTQELQIFDTTPAEDNEELCIIPDAKTLVSQEENGVQTAEKKKEPQIFVTTPAEDNEELCIIPDAKTHVSQEENGVQIVEKKKEPQIFVTTPAEDNEELCIIPDTKTLVSQEENGAQTVEKKKDASLSTPEPQIFDITPAEDNEELCIIPDAKTLLSQEENGVQTAEKKKEPQIFVTTPAEDNEELCIVPDAKTLVSQEGNGVQTAEKKKEPQIFVTTPAEDNEELCIVPNTKTLVSQEENGVQTAEKKKEPQIFVTTPAEDNEELCIVPDAKTLVSQEENGAQTVEKKKEPQIFVTTPAEDNEELCIIPDAKTLVSQEENGVQTVEKKKEPQIFVTTPTEDNEELCIIPDTKTRVSQKENGAQTAEKKKEPQIFVTTPAEDNEELCIIPDAKTLVSQEENGVEKKKEPQIFVTTPAEDNEELCIIPDAKTLVSQKENGVQTVEKKKEPQIFVTTPAEDNEEICIIPDTKILVSQEENGAQTVEKKKDASLSTPEPQIFDITPAEDNEELCIIPDTKTSICQEENGGQTKKDSSVSTEMQLEELMASVNNRVESADNLQIKVINRLEHAEEATNEVCHQCCTYKKCVFKVDNPEKTFLCSETCVISFRVLNKPTDIYKQNTEYAQDCVNQIIFIRKCAECKTNIKTEDENVLGWETLDFCNEDCLCKYQTKICSNCAFCKQPVWRNNLGKYCVRFGYDLRQFCRSLCLEEFKKGLKVCTYCQKDISDDSEGFLAATSEKQFKEFCSKLCVEKYENLNGKNSDIAILPKVIINCAVCNIEKNVQVLYEVQTEKESRKIYFCSQPCFVAYKFVTKINPLQCETCKIYFETDNSVEFSMFYEQKVNHFCCKSCQNIYIIFNRRIVPCSWCKVKKYNFDMIKKSYKTGQTLIMCSLNCLSLFQVSLKAISTKKVKCDYCNKVTNAQYYLTMSDATVRNFCTNQCIVNFQNVLAKNKRLLQVPKKCPAKNDANKLPVITNVQSLATQNPPQVIHHFIVKAPPLPPMKNAITSCQPIVHTKGTNCRPSQSSKSTQTDFTKERVALIPFPVPIYIPAPLPMFCAPLPVPIPFPLPIPVPVFIPTTRNSTAGILKELKKIQVKIPTDPYEAEMVLMAQMVAGDEQIINSDSESSCSNKEYATENEPFIPEQMDTSNSFGDDKMAADSNEPIMDFEDSLTANTIISNSQNQNISTVEESQNGQAKEKRKMAAGCRKRSKNQAKNTPAAKKGRLKSFEMEIPSVQPIQTSENIIKPDANMCLKYMLGVNAWKLWITQKNSELGKHSCQEFKNDILQLTADELNYSLSHFVQEVRKPSGEEYAPDTIFYLCLGIQQYLFENNRIDNIFTDLYYEKFTDSLDEISRKFSVLYDDSQYIVTRVEEEHLWEIKQLGVHSPYVLLHTLLYFNTKYFNLTTVEEHMQLTFSNIMRHWNDNKKETATEPKKVFLKFYAPKTIWHSKPHKKRIYEQVENEENSFRCPVKLYEFYLTKTPECVKSSRDMFYLTPERSCLPESPKWYTPMPLSPKVVEKMLHRIKMVKEINVAMLSMA